MKAFKLLTILFVAAIPFLSVAQNNSDQVHIKIDAIINGEKINIDTTIDDLGDFDLEEYLEQLGIEDDMSELNIDITDDAAYNFDFNFDEDALNEMLQNLENIEMPELPEMPDMPALAPLENLYFSNGNKAFLGVMTETMEKNEGVKITEVIENTAAAEAGLKIDDVITKIDEKTIESTNNLIEVLSVYNPGDKVKITYLRNGKTETLNATLKENEEYKNWEEYEKNWEKWGEEYEKQWENWEKQNGEKWENWNTDSSMYHFEERGFLGVIIDDMDDEAGVKISDIVEESAAEEVGLKAGDIINSIDGKKMKNYNDVLEAIQSKKPGDVINVNYTREGKTNDVKATLKGSRKMIGDEEGMIWDAPMPGTGIKVFSCPTPVNAYCYTLKDGDKKTINMSIKVISNDAHAPSPDNSSKSQGSLLDPETIQFYPNPTTGIFNLKFNLNQNGDTEITIRDIDGKVVYTESLQGFEGSYEKPIDLGQSAKGTYFINVKQNDYTATKQIVLQ